MSWVIFAFAASIISIGVSLTDKYIVTRTTPAAYTVLIGIFSAPVLLLIPLTGAAWPSLAFASFGIVLGLLLSFIIYAMLRAFKAGEVSRLAPLSILSTVIISVGDAVFFGTHLSVTQYWALILFLLGAVLLATRIETKVEFIDDLTQLRFRKVAKNLSRGALHAARDPLGAGVEISGSFVRAVSDVMHKGSVFAHDPLVQYVKFKKRLRLARGIGWYLIAVLLVVPYLLLVKELNLSVGVVTGFVSIRMGLIIGALLIMIGAWDEVRLVFRRPRLAGLAAFKELFGATSGFLSIYAASIGPLALVRSFTAIDAVGIFIVGSVLARYGIIRESLQRRDIAQKAFGVLIVAIATLLLTSV